MAGNARRAVADDLLADFRPHAVAGDEGAAARLLAALELDRDAVAVIGEVVDTPRGLERDQVAALTGLEIDAVDVGPMGDGVRLLEPGDELLAERNRRDLGAGQRIAHLQPAGFPGVAQHVDLEADALEGAKDVRSELNAGAELAKFGRLLEHPHRESLAGVRVGGHQPADAAARNEERQIPTVRFGHASTPLFSTDGCLPA